MFCIVCRMRHLDDEQEPIRPASYIVSGSGLCALDVDRVVETLSRGYSMREILDEARSGDWG